MKSLNSSNPMASKNGKSLLKRFSSMLSLKTIKKIDPRHNVPPSSSSVRSANTQESEVDTVAHNVTTEADLFSQYEFGALIGKGGSAEVYKVQHKQSGKFYACKVLGKNLKMNDVSTMQTELTILSKANHENVLSLTEVFDTPKKLYIIMELVEGDLIEALHSLPVYSEEAVAELFAQILAGVAHLHELGIVHRDLKVDNLLYIRKEGRIIVKIADFGLSAIVEGNFNEKSRKFFSGLNQVWGTTEYFAPEVYSRKYGFQADSWALGCVLFEMLTGELCFPVREFHVNTIDKLLLGTPLRRFEVNSQFLRLSAPAQQLIRKLLKHNPRRRWSVAEALGSEWLSGRDNSSLSTSAALSSTGQIVAARAERRAKRVQFILLEKQRDLAYEKAASSATHV